MNRRLSIRAALGGIAVALLLSGCALIGQLRGLEPPEISWLRLEVRSVAADKARVDFVLNARNPNKFSLRNVAVDYELFHDDRRFLSGNEIRLDLAAGGDTEIRIPADIFYLDVLATAAALTRQVLSGATSIPVRLDATVKGKLPLYNDTAGGIPFNKALTHTQAVPLPRLEDIQRRF
jgi:LEA14-like dessication related protein